jgi:hypothetical protein
MTKKSPPTSLAKGGLGGYIFMLFFLLYLSSGKKGGTVLKKTEHIGKEVIKSISEDCSELYHFIDFVKIYAIALKIAFRSDRAAAWGLLGIFLREFEKIGMYRRSYDQKIDEVAEMLKDCCEGDVESRMNNIVEEARKLKDKFEELHAETVKRRTKKSEGRGTTVRNAH